MDIARAAVRIDGRPARFTGRGSGSRRAAGARRPGGRGHRARIRRARARRHRRSPMAATSSGRCGRRRETAAAWGRPTAIGRGRLPTAPRSRRDRRCGLTPAIRPAHERQERSTTDVRLPHLASHLRHRRPRRDRRPRPGDRLHPLDPRRPAVHPECRRLRRRRHRHRRPARARRPVPLGHPRRPDGLCRDRDPDVGHPGSRTTRPRTSPRPSRSPSSSSSPSTSPATTATRSRSSAASSPPSRASSPAAAPPPPAPSPRPTDTDRSHRHEAPDPHLRPARAGRRAGRLFRRVGGPGRAAQRRRPAPRAARR